MADRPPQRRRSFPRPLGIFIHSDLHEILDCPHGDGVWLLLDPGADHVPSDRVGEDLRTVVIIDSWRIRLDTLL